MKKVICLKIFALAVLFSFVSVLQGFVMAKNSENGLLLEIKSEHFKIQYNLCDEKAIPDIQKALEDNYERITKNLNQELDKQVPVKIYSDMETLQKAIKSEFGYEASKWTTAMFGHGVIMMLSPLNPTREDLNYSECVKSATMGIAAMIVEKINSEGGILATGICRYEANLTNRPLKLEHLPSSIEKMFSWDMRNVGAPGERSFPCAQSLAGFIVENYGYEKMIELLKKDYFHNGLDNEIREIYEKWITKTKNDLALSERFVHVEDIIHNVKLAMIFYSEHNFTGGRVDGYKSETAILTKEAVEALKKANEIFNEKGFGIKIVDTYRPQSAVNHFKRWAQDIDDNRMQKYFYPNIDKRDLFKLGYVAEKSTHSRGSTVDMTLFNLETGEDLDMGSVCGMLDKISNRDTKLITKEQQENRNLLTEVMENCGFTIIPQEWWHFTLKDEPFPDTYFDFPIK